MGEGEGRDGSGATAGKGRADRLAERLRENLRRRKAQARSRRSGQADPRAGLGDSAKKAPESPDDGADGG
jgi:hypothetical protein